MAEALTRADIKHAVDALFVNGTGERADRLVLVVDGPRQRDLGGWCPQAIMDRLVERLIERRGSMNG